MGIKKKILHTRCTPLAILCALLIVFIIKVSLYTSNVSINYTIDSSSLKQHITTENSEQVAFKSSKSNFTSHERKSLEPVSNATHYRYEVSTTTTISRTSIKQDTTKLAVKITPRSKSANKAKGSYRNMVRSHPNQQDYINIVTKKIVPVNLMEAGPFNFLPNYRNPCWSYDSPSKEAPIHCLPYFYMIGAPKAGTTDMFTRLVRHPEISQHVVKEPHWLTRKRFYSIGNLTAQTNLTHYIKYFNAAARHIHMAKDKNDYHSTVVGDCSASTMWDNSYWNILPEYRNLTEPLYTNADYIHHLNPKTKIIAMLRNPIDRLYSDYLFFKADKKGPQLFHREVKVVLQELNECLRAFSLRQCINRPWVNMAAREIRVGIGIYHQHLKEYYRVFPPEQVLVIKLEDFSKHSVAYMTKIFDFLELKPLSAKTLNAIGNTKRHANARRVKDRKVGDMLPETRQLLQEFYKFHNDQLGSLLGEQFNYNNHEKEINL